MAEKVRWGILSTANIGKKKVIPAIQQSRNGEVAAVASRSMARAQAFVDELGIPKAFGSYQEMIESGEVDAVYNPLPNSEHAKWSIACAEAGVPCLCEKPLAGNAKDAQRMVDAFAEKNVLFAEAFMYRFHPQHEVVLQLIADGAVGTPQIINAAFTFSMGSEDNIRLQPALEGGSLRDVGCYCINAMRLLTGEEPDGGQAFAIFGKNSNVDENMSAILSFPSGVTGHFDCGFRAQRANFYDIKGTEGRIRIEPAFIPDGDEQTVVHYWSGTNEPQYQPLEVGPANQYTLMAEDFADAMLNNRPPRFSPQDGVSNMVVIDSLLASARDQDGYWS